MENHIRNRYANQEYLVITSKTQVEKNKVETNVHRLGLKRYHQNTFRQQLKKYSVIRYFHRFIWPDDKIIFNIWCLVYYILFLRKKDDHIFTISHPFSSHLIGYYLKKFHKHVWTADMGDVFFLPHQKDHPFKKWNLLVEKKILLECDHIFVNADSMRDYFIDQYQLDKSKFQVLPNGNRLDFSKVKRNTFKNLRLTYFGNTYEGIRDGLADIDIFIQLRNQYPELNFNIQLIGVMYFPLLEKIKNHQSWIRTGICNTDEELVAAYSETDVLLNFANKNYPGIPSKLEEYIASGIPVIHFCWQHNDPSSIYLQQQNHPYLEYILNYSEISMLKNFIEKFTTQSGMSS